MSKRLASLFLSVFLTLLVAGLFSTCVLAQTRDLASLSGQVLDPQGKAIPGATVTLTNPAIGLNRSTQTDSSGYYAFTGLGITENYSVQVQASGFKTAQENKIELRAGASAIVNLTLSISGDQTQITVYGTPGNVNVDTDQVTTRLDTEKIEETPIYSRKVTAVPLLDSAARQAQTTGDIFMNEVLFVLNGTGRRQTDYVLDNTEDNDRWGRQTMFAAVPMSVVQELNVDKNTISTEYGRNAGTAVSLVTRSGSNDWHGDFVVMGRPQAGQANMPLTTRPAYNTAIQGSGMVSGPIVKDKSFFLFSMEYTDQNRDAIITSPVAPGTVYTGNFTQTLLFARLDQQLNANNRLTLRGNFDRFQDTNPSDAVSGVTLPSAARVFDKNMYQAALTETATINPNLVNEFRFQYLLASPVTQFLPVHQSPQLFISGTYTWGESRLADLMNHQYQWADTLSWSKGRHQIKAGADVSYSSSGGYGQEFGSGYLLGRYQINSAYASIPIATVLTYNPGLVPPGFNPKGPPLASSFTQSFGDATYNVKETLLGLFVQDNYRVSQNLVLNLGLRYDMQTISDARNDFAPRVGFAYTFHKDLPTVIRGGYGIYYSELRANLYAASNINGPEGVFTYTVQPGQQGFPTSFVPITNIPPGTILPPRDITILAGQCNYLNQFLPVSQLHFCPNSFVNPYTQQWNFGVEQQLGKNWVLSMDYIGSHTINLEQPIDLNAPSAFNRTAQGQTRTAAQANATRPIIPVNGGYRQVLAIMNMGSAYYDGLQVNLRKQFSNHFSLLASYTWSHTINTVEWDGTGQNPNSYTCPYTCEKANSVLNQTNRGSVSGTYAFPYGIQATLFAFLGSGYPYNITTGVDNNGDGNTSDRPVVNGAVVPRDWGAGTPIYNIATALQKNFKIKERSNLSLRWEVFNVLNYQNIYGRNGTYGNNATPNATLGAEVGGIANIGAPRQMQFLAQYTF